MTEAPDQTVPASPTGAPQSTAVLAIPGRTLNTVLRLHPNPDTQTFPPMVHMAPKAAPFIP